MTTRSAEREEFLQDVFTCFVEDYGYNQWRYITSYKWEGLEPNEVSATIMEVGDGDVEQAHTVNIAVVAAGINAIRSPEFSINSRLKATILEEDRENECCNIDAEAADVIVQAALFGSIIYG